MPDDATRVALMKAARFILAEIKRRAPTAKSSASFRIEGHGADLDITSYDEGTAATVYGWRHPLFGDRADWYGPAGHQIGRKDFVNRSADRAAQDAAERFGDEWARIFVEGSAIWEEAD